MPLARTADGMWRVPALVKGRLVWPPEVSRSAVDAALRAARSAPSAATADGGVWLRLDAAQVLCRPRIDAASLLPTGEYEYLLLPTVDPPMSLVEADPSALVDLYALRFDEVLAYLAGVRDLVTAPELVSPVAEFARATSMVADRSVELFVSMLPYLLDPTALREDVDRQLGHYGMVGSRFLDEWVAVPGPVHHGSSGLMSERRGQPLPAQAVEVHVRAVPTRQLHITAGNSPIVPFVSLMRALATKGAAVVKMPALSPAATTLMALAMYQLDPEHPITRHTSLVYWKGGDRRFEDPLLATGAFDRVLVWGSDATLRALLPRLGATRALLFQPRYGISLIGREMFGGNLDAVAAGAAADVMIGNQAACTASLVHYVEGTRSEVLEYCRCLQSALRAWDELLPHRLSRSTLAQLRRLRRGEFVDGTWFENGQWPDTTSVVVFLPKPFDVALHPLSRCVVVRQVDDLREALPFIHAAVSTVGVYPEPRRAALRGDLSARGVSTIAPLGATERVFAGMPHDGMRVLSDLVNWTIG